MKSKITVIMPVYNAEKYVGRALESLLNQSVKEINIICIDDGSTDQSKQIIKDYASKDSRIKLIENSENLGIGKTRNIGLDYIFSNSIDTEYIAMMDADDRIELNCYERAYSEAKKVNADIVNYNFLPSTYWQYKTEANSEIIDFHNNCLNAIFDRDEYYTFIVCWSKIYRKELLKDIRFLGSSFFEDGSFAYQVLPRTKIMRVIPDTLYEYNIENPNSSCSKVNEHDRLKAIFNTIQFTVNDWKNLGIFDENKYKYIQHILNYASLVCPNALEGNYLDELNNAFQLNILGEDVKNNINENTKMLIKKMTK